MDNDPLLELRGFAAGYGSRKVVGALDMKVSPGTVMALIGHNGSGKSTLLKALFGMASVFSGEVLFAQHRVGDLSPPAWHRRGVAFAPQGNKVFNDLTVFENIMVGAASFSDRRDRNEMALRTVLQALPSLEPFLRRRAETLSGGEKQFVALGIAMASSPRVLLLDEPSLGLSPAHLTQVFSMLKGLVAYQKMTIVISEQKVREVLEFSDLVMVLRRGECVFSGPSNELGDSGNLLRRYFS